MIPGVQNHVFTAEPKVFDSFNSGSKTSAAQAQSVPVASAQVSDVYQTSQEQPKKKRGLVGSVNHFISGCKKLGAGISEFAKGTFKGIGAGAAVGGSIYGVAAAVNGVKNFMGGHAAKKAGEEFVAKKLSKAFPALAILAGVATLGINIWKAKLNYNERRSDLEHRYEEPHLKS